MYIFEGTECSEEYATQLREEFIRNVTALLLRVVVVIILDWETCDTFPAAVNM